MAYTITSANGGAVIGTEGVADTINNLLSSVTITASSTDDTISNLISFVNEDRTTPSNVSIDGGAGADDIINNGDDSTINGGDGNDNINSYSVGRNTIIGGADNDTIGIAGNYHSVDGGAGNDVIFNSGATGFILDNSFQGGSNNTLIGGAGDDTIITQSDGANIYVYNEGDGNDVIYNYALPQDLENSVYNYSDNYTLQINGNWSSVTSGNDIVVTVGDGSITLVDAAGSNVNITGGETTPQPAPQPVDSSFTLEDTMTYGDHTYYLISTTNQTGADAWNNANSWLNTNYGAHLAIIDNEAENTALFNFVESKLTQYGVYFGVSDAETEDTWIDVKDNTIYQNGSPINGAYVNWGDGEPSKYNASEDYAMFYAYTSPKYGWNDGSVGYETNDPAGTKYYFLGETDGATPAPTPDTLTPDTSPVLGNAVYDIVFIVDTSGSMSNYIDRVNAIAEKFADILNARQIHDYRLAVVDYETEPFAYNLATDGSGGIFTTSTDANAIQTFKDAMSAAAKKTSGATENGLTAINHAINNFSFREGANVEFILLTDEDYDDGTDVDYVTATKENLKTHEIQLDVIGEKGYTCESEWTPMAQATGGNFYDITGDYTDTFNKIVGNLDQINVDLSTVPDGQTGYFQFNPSDPNLKGKNSTTAVFFATEQPGLEKAGEVTADKGYIAFSQNYRQNISIPDGWNVTATSKNDVLNVTGTGAGVVITSGEGHDAINLGESATGIILTDHDLTNDMLSFATRQTPGTFTESVELNSETNLNQVTLAAPTMTVVLQNFINSNENLLKYNVTNGQYSNTVDELLNGESEHKRGMYQIHFNEWHYSFTPPELANSDDLASDFGSPTLEEISPASFAVTATDFALTDPTEIAPLPTEIASLALSRES